MAVKTKDLSNDEDYHSCIFLVNNAGLGKRTNAECQILSQELGAYGPRLSAWIDVYAADPTHGRSSVAYMRVVNTFLERWSPGKWPRGCEGFSYNTATTSFSISREVWEGLDAEFRGDFDAARKLFG